MFPCVRKNKIRAPTKVNLWFHVTFVWLISIYLYYMCACVSICANECLHGDYIYIYCIYKENTGWWYTLATVMYRPTWWCQVASDDLQKIRFFLHQPGSFPHQGQFMVIISNWYRWVGSFIGKHTLEITLLRVIPARHRTYILPYISLLVFCCFSNILSNFLHATWHLLWRSTWHCSWHSIWQILCCFINFINNILHSVWHFCPTC